jgi:hypothetical protein
MAAKCPHCSAAIESLSGFVPQADLEARLKEKNTKVDELTRQVADLTPKATGYDAMTADLARARQEAAVAREDLGLAARGLTDPKKIAALRAIHGAEMSGVEESKRVSFAPWLDTDDAKQHPVVGMVLTPAAAAPAAPGAPVPVVTPPAAPAAPPPAVAAPAAPAVAAPPANQLPAVNTNAVTPPTNTPQLTPAQLAAHFASPAYLALKPEERRAERARLEAQYGGQTQQRPVAA